MHIRGICIRHAGGYGFNYLKIQAKRRGVERRFFVGKLVAVSEKYLY